MKTLRECYESNPAIALCTDKDTVHSYLDFYEREFTGKSVNNFLEIGIWRGGSLELWNKYFPEANIYGVDINPPCEKGIYGKVHVVKADAYQYSFVSEFPNNYFDIIIDDGPHTIESQILAVVLYYPKLAYGGRMYIEDIQSEDQANLLLNLANRVADDYFFHDFRSIKGRYDDMIIELRKD